MHGICVFHCIIGSWLEYLPLLQTSRDPLSKTIMSKKKSQRLSKATFSLDRFWNNLDSASKYLQNEMNFVSCSQIALMLSSR